MKAGGYQMDRRNTNQSGLQKSRRGMEETNRSVEKEFQVLLTYTQQLEAEIVEQREQNKNFASKQLEMLEMQRNSFQQQLKNMEENELPLLKKSLQDVSMEKDAAIIAREDLLAQLRVVKRRLREVEEEQYKAEEDAATLRAEVNMLQRQEERQQNSKLPSSTITPEHFRVMEQEMAKMKVELQKVLQLRQQEQQRLAAEKESFALFKAEKEMLEEKLVVANKKLQEMASVQAGQGGSSIVENKKPEKGKHERLHDLALMVERLESGRQKLLAEIDAQSLEIEKLFVENANLSASLQEMTGVAAQWENQVQECLKQNAELRASLDKLRTEQANSVASLTLTNEDAKSSNEITEANQNGINGAGVYAAENLKLKGALAKTKTKAEALAAQVIQLSAELRHAVQSYNGLMRLYTPILWSIENRLIQMKEDKFVSEAIL